jgi:hypothetical protein
MWKGAGISRNVRPNSSTARCGTTSACGNANFHDPGAGAYALQVIRCPSCGFENLGGARFCSRFSFVSFAIDSGDEHKVAGSITRIAPDLWAEGLAEPVRIALRRARERGVANAEEAIAAVDKSGPRSPVVRAIVRRLGADLWARAQGDRFRMGWQPWPPRVLA